MKGSGASNAKLSLKRTLANLDLVLGPDDEDKFEPVHNRRMGRRKHGRH